MWLSRHRLRPILAWSMYGGGHTIVQADMPDGSPSLMVRITNVGQVAAVDIVSRTVTGIESDEPAAPANPTRGFVGSLHPGASVDLPIGLSEGELAGIRGGETVKVDIRLDYETVDGRRYPYEIVGLYSSSLGVLETTLRG